MTWVYNYPEWLLFTMVVIGMGLAAALGLILFRKIVPQSDDMSHNDVAGPIVSMVGTILAVILSFMLVSVWQQYDQAGGTVVQEASAVADLYHAAGNFPEPTQTQLRNALKDYTNAIIGDEWPAMRTGAISETATKAQYGILGIILRYEPGPPHSRRCSRTRLRSSTRWWIRGATACSTTSPASRSSSGSGCGCSPQ